MTIHQRLKLARERAGYASIHDAAAKFGWQGPTVHKHEAGHLALSLTRAADYARCYGVSLDWLAGLTEAEVA